MKKFRTINLEVKCLSKKGRGLATLENSKKPIEISATLPGEAIIAEVPAGRVRKKRGKLIEVVKASPDRVKPLCSHFGVCGGCTLQHQSYKAQTALKSQRIRNLFSHLAPKESFHDLLPCESPFEYRNKMEFSFSQDKEGKHYLGLMRSDGRSRVEDLSLCHLTEKWYSQVLGQMRIFWKESQLKAYHMPSDSGSLLTLTLRGGMRTGFKLAMLTVSGNTEYALKKSNLEAFKAALYKALPDHENRLSIYLQVRVAKKGVPTNFFETHLAGPKHLREELHMKIAGEKRILDLKISPSSFFQPNTLQAEKLYAQAISLLKLSGSETLLDLYCGTGTIGLACAPFVSKVYSVEINPYAVCDGEQNRDLNGMHNLEFVRGDVGTQLQEQNIKGDVAIIDPPRAGLDKRAIEELIKIAPGRICYISCNPETQAENMLPLIDAGYTITHVRPVDQFPQTMHIENIVILDR